MPASISARDLAVALQSTNPPRLLDVREREEHEFVNLPNSRLVPLGELYERAGELADWKDQSVVVYCHHGIRSQHAIAMLSQFGFTQLTNLSGGIDAWTTTVDPNLPRY